VVVGLLLIAGSIRAQEPQPAEPVATAQGQEALALAASPLGTSFTYQGQLQSGGAPVNASCSMTFWLYDSLNGDNAIGSPITTTVPISGGLFTVGLDFGASTDNFNGDARWLDIRVKCPADSVYVTLTPRQELRPAPYALHVADLLAYNPNNRGASVALNWYNDGTQDWPRIRYGGNFTGSVTGLLIQGPHDVTKMAIVNDGNVGIGTTSPGARLDIAGGSILLDAHQAIYGNSSSGSNSGFIELYDGNTGDMNLGTTFGTGDIAFTAGGGERMRIASTGRVGLGTTAPGARLHIVAASGERAMYLSGGATIISTSLSSKWNLPPSPVGNATLSAITSNPRTSDGIGFFEGNDVCSPVVWMYAADGRNAFTVAVMTFTNTADISAIDSYLTPLFQVRENGRVGIGTVDPQQTLDVNGTARAKVVQITGGSDLAEPFAVSGAVEPGMVVAIDPQNPGLLRVATGAYDRTVVGCVSGAGGVNPGLVMQQGEKTEEGLPVALSGRVYCWADAAYGPIQPGDLLTTSDTPGHIMSVQDYDRARGAAIGKAMSGLESGRGLVLVLVTLQ
jgi:hypothetical protein